LAVQAVESSLTDRERTVVWRGEYYPYGELYAEYVSASNEIRFPGQWHDRESGLYYNWHRYYDPSTGRYLQSDPIGLAGGMNLYAYAKGNPLGIVDPTGLWVPTWDPATRSIDVTAEDGDGLENLYSQLSMTKGEFANYYKIEDIDTYKVVPGVTTFSITEFVLRSVEFNDASDNMNCFSSTLAGTDAFSPETHIHGGMKFTEEIQKVFGFQEIEAAHPGSVVTWVNKSGVTHHAAIYVLTSLSGTQYYFGRPGPGADLGLQTDTQTKQLYEGFTLHFMDIINP
jgi:RHS repeat-associated protein